MARQRLINCDFLNVSGFMSNLSNKAKLLYYCYLVNADDLGFVGNAYDIATTLDRCEETYENVLFQYKYVDAINELVEKRLVFEFSDKVGNKTYLIKHWFYHNKYKTYLSTNFVAYFSQVEIVNNEYHLKTIKRENLSIRESEIKVNQIKPNKNHYDNKKVLLDSEDNNVEKENKEKENDEWDNFLKELNEMPINNN